jgi:hypothetical protein
VRRCGLEPPAVRTCCARQSTRRLYCCCVAETSAGSPAQSKAGPKESRLPSVRRRSFRAQPRPFVLPHFACSPPHMIPRGRRPQIPDKPTSAAANRFQVQRPEPALGTRDPGKLVADQRCHHHASPAASTATSGTVAVAATIWRPRFPSAVCGTPPRTAALISPHDRGARSDRADDA